jgi:S-adenosylmethionine:tRNA ribosyltransferase-isomerase
MPSLSDYDYDLPAALIAQEPCPERDRARLLVVDRAHQSLTHSHFYELPRWLDDRDVLVINDTRVFPARLRGRKLTGGKVEALLLEPLRFEAAAASHHRARVRALWRSAKPPRPGQQVVFSPDLTGEIMAVGQDGEVSLQLSSQTDDLRTVLARTGEVPLPPYIRRPQQDLDRHRYQTIFASHEGAVAAPTAGLHFTPAVLAALTARGVTVVPLTLHVGPGTFQPVRGDDYTQHRLAPEYFILPAATAEIINQAKASGRRIVAVGTTCTRVLEYCWHAGIVRPGEGWCDLYIHPGYQFHVVDRLITNFHLPKTTLLLLVSAFAGRDLILQAYRTAVAHAYRFYSYGDSMLIL